MTRVVVTAAGPGRVAVPPGAYAFDAQAYAPGASGNGVQIGGNRSGGGGGAFAGVSGIPCSYGQTLYWNVGTGGLGVSTGVTNGNDGSGPSWVATPST